MRQQCAPRSGKRRSIAPPSGCQRGSRTACTESLVWWQGPTRGLAPALIPRWLHTRCTPPPSPPPPRGSALAWRLWLCLFVLLVRLLRTMAPPALYPVGLALALALGAVPPPQHYPFFLAPCRSTAPSQLVAAYDARNFSVLGLGAASWSPEYFCVDANCKGFRECRGAAPHVSHCSQNDRVNPGANTSPNQQWALDHRCAAACNATTARITHLNPSGGTAAPLVCLQPCPHRVFRA